MIAAAIFGIALTALTAPAATILIDFGQSTTTTTATGWNNVTNAGANTVSNLVDSTGTATTFDLSIGTPAFTTTGGGISNTGTTAGPYPSTATSDFFFAFVSSTTASGAQVILSDLSASTNYSFKFYASRVGGSGTRSTTYTATGLNTGSAVLEPSGNISNVAQVDNIQPTIGNVISIDLFRTSLALNSTGTVLLGVMEITTTPAPEPGTLSLLAFAGVPMLMRRRRTRLGA